MPEVRLTPAARADLLEIGRYTQRQWGAGQRTKYLSAFAGKFADLVEDQTRGRRRDDLRPGLWSARLGRHIIFFRRLSGGVEVLRVLHQAQDFRRHLR